MSTNDPRVSARGDQLAAGAALFGLESDEQAELDSLDLPDDLGLELELLAASVAAAAYEARAEQAEPLPASLVAKILAPGRAAQGEEDGRGRVGDGLAGVGEELHGGKATKASSASPPSPLS